VSDAGNGAREDAARVGRDLEFDTCAVDDAGNVLFGDGSDEAEARELLENDEDGVGAGADERAGVDEAVGNDPVEGGGNAEIGFEILERSDGGFGGCPRLLARADERLRGFDLLAGDFDFVAGDSAGSFCGFLEFLERGLEDGDLGFGLETVSLRYLDFGFGFGDAGFDFGSGELDEEVALVDRGAAIDGYFLDVAGDLGVESNGEVGLELAGEVDGAGDGLGEDGGEFLGMRGEGKRGKEEGAFRRRDAETQRKTQRAGEGEGSSVAESGVRSARVWGGVLRKMRCTGLRVVRRGSRGIETLSLKGLDAQRRGP
jgi:hypothetical protein